MGRPRGDGPWLLACNSLSPPQGEGAVDLVAVRVRELNLLAHAGLIAVGSHLEGIPPISMPRIRDHGRVSAPRAGPLIGGSRNALPIDRPDPEARPHHRRPRLRVIDDPIDLAIAIHTRHQRLLLPPSNLRSQPSANRSNFSARRGCAAMTASSSSTPSPGAGGGST